MVTAPELLSRDDISDAQIAEEIGNDDVLKRKSKVAAFVDLPGVPEGTIKTRVFHAKKLLMRCLSGRIERRVPA